MLTQKPNRTTLSINREIEVNSFAFSEVISRQEDKLAEEREQIESLTEKPAIQDAKPVIYIENDFESQTLDKDVKVVVDKETGLMWQQSGTRDFNDFDEAQLYIKQLNSFKHAGYNDWCLPKLEDALTLLEQDSNSDGLFINPEFDEKQTWIWTSTNSASGNWVVDFSTGTHYSATIDNDYFVRAVRYDEPHNLNR